MFKPSRLVYLEAVPGKGPEALTTKNFLGELKKFGYDKEKAKDAVYKGALKEKGGYKLTKAEALFAAGKIKTTFDLDNAAAYALNVGDIDDFLNQYGGDKYVKRLFAYGTSKMERDFMAKKQNFEKEKKLGGAFEGLKQYATFEDAFNAGFYKDMAVDFDAIMEKGLSVSEYRQRDERFRKLEKKVKRIEQEGGKYPDQKPVEPSKYKEQKAKLPPSRNQPQKSPTEPPQAIEKTPPKPQESAAEQEKKLKYEKAKYKLSELGKSMRKTDAFMSETIKKYKENSEAGDIMFGDLKNFEPLGDTSNEDKYLEAFFNKGAIKKDIGASGKKFNDYDDTLYVLRPEILQEFIDGYDELTQKKLDELGHLERVLYNKALGGVGLSKPEEAAEGEIAKEKEKVRKEEEANAKKEIPEIEQVEGYKQSLNLAKAEWRLAARNIP